MKILDATTIIAICNEIHCPELIEKIALLGHDLAIPAHIVESELLDKNTRKTTERYVHHNTIQILKKNTIEEVREFQKDFPGLGLGECDSMLAYQKLREDGERVYCILDDGKAREKAAELEIKFTGLVGLLQMMKQKNVMSHDEIDKVVKLLKDSNFGSRTNSGQIRPCPKIGIRVLPARVGGRIVFKMWALDGVPCLLFH